MAFVSGAYGSWPSRLGVRFGHYASSMLMVSIVAVIAVGLRPLPGLLMLTVPLALFVLVLFLFGMMRNHDRRLCEQCASDIPINPAARAKKLQRRFWMAHTGSEPRFLIPYLVVLIGSNFATSTFGHYCWAAIQATMIYLILSQRTHRQLQPWCPWCSDGGGGEEVDDVPPVLPHDDREFV